MLADKRLDRLSIAAEVVFALPSNLTQASFVRGGPLSLAIMCCERDEIKRVPSRVHRHLFFARSHWARRVGEDGMSSAGLVVTRCSMERRDVSRLAAAPNGQQYIAI